MKALIIYDTLFGNTKQIAEAIAAGLSEEFQVTVKAATDVTDISDDLDLLLLGGPTHRHGLSDGMRDLLDRIPAGSLSLRPIATFDTRYHGPGWITGSAANVVVRKLRHLRAHQVVPPESFFISRVQSENGAKRNHESEHLEDGEIQRATDWGRLIAALRLPVA